MFPRQIRRRREQQAQHHHEKPPFVHIQQKGVEQAAHGNGDDDALQGVALDGWQFAAVAPGGDAQAQQQCEADDAELHRGAEVFVVGVHGVQRVGAGHELAVLLMQAAGAGADDGVLGDETQAVVPELQAQAEGIGVQVTVAGAFELLVLLNVLHRQFQTCLGHGKGGERHARQNRGTERANGQTAQLEVLPRQQHDEGEDDDIAGAGDVDVEQIERHPQRDGRPQPAPAARLERLAGEEVGGEGHDGAEVDMALHHGFMQAGGHPVEEPGIRQGGGQDRTQQECVDGAAAPARVHQRHDQQRHQQQLGVLAHEIAHAVRGAGAVGGADGEHQQQGRGPQRRGHRTPAQKLLAPAPAEQPGEQQQDGGDGAQCGGQG